LQGRENGHQRLAEPKPASNSPLSNGPGVIPASGKKIVLPEDATEFKIQGDKIVSNRAYGDSGGFAAFLAPLGVKLPSQ